MKQIQVILTIDVSNDEYSELLNESMNIESLVHRMLEDGDKTLSFDFPAVIIQRLSK